MRAFDIFLLVSAGLVGLVALLAVPLKRWVSSPLLALFAGVLLASSPAGELLSPDRLALLEQAARVSLAIGLMASALRIKRREFHSEWRSAALLLAVLMPLMWISSGLAAYFALGLSFTTALLLGAVITPTDPVTAGAIITGELAEKHIPIRLRTLISLESGANDGLNYVFVFLPLLLIELPPGAAVREWFFSIVLWNVAGSVAIGLVIGFAAARLTRWAERSEKRGPTYILVFSSALALFALAVGELLGTDGILAVFAAGIVFDYILEASDIATPEEVQEAIDLLFTMPVFVLIGMALPWQEWIGMGWKALAFVTAVSLLRRFPGVVLMRPLLAKRYSASQQFLIGLAGPIGVASVYYATLVARRLHWDAAWEYASLAIFSSVLLHGLAAPHLVQALGDGRSSEQKQ
jgi:sodium/hydrogen antiporter